VRRIKAGLTQVRGRVRLELGDWGGGIGLISGTISGWELESRGEARLTPSPISVGLPLSPISTDNRHGVTPKSN
jgi:hypothetical protein